MLAEKRIRYAAPPPSFEAMFVQRVETLQVSFKFCPKCGKDLANNKERMWKTLSQVELLSV